MIKSSDSIEEVKRKDSAEAIEKLKSIMHNSVHLLDYVCPEPLKKHIGDEEFLLSCELNKFNKFGWK